MQVTYLDHMGTDLTVVNAARVSFGKKSSWEAPPTLNPVTGFDVAGVLKPSDRSLIKFLARGYTQKEWYELLAEIISCDDAEHANEIAWKIKNRATHFAPFTKTQLLLHFRIPLFVARQLYKHQVGFQTPSEESRRYISDTPEIYSPQFWRRKAENKKQGSGEAFIHYDQQDISKDYNVTCENAVNDYETLISFGVAPEQARGILPQSAYIEFQWSGTIAAWARLYNQRIDPHAQAETQEVARMIGKIASRLFPYSWEELTI